MGAQRSPPLHILVIEDDRSTADYICSALMSEGHSVDVQYDGKEGLKYAVAASYDVLIVDRMLPGMDGVSIVKTMRSVGVSAPVLFLTALGGVDDRVEGLEAGGDDYVVKPFADAELMARVNALARRPPTRQEATILTVADLEMNLISRKVRRGDQEIDLPPREFKLLEFLMRNQGRVMTKSMLLEHVWDFHFDPKTSVVDTHISRVRNKIDRPFDKPLIQTVRGVGYSINDNP
jgi:two-component system, OmpR family, response regulator